MTSYTSTLLRMDPSKRALLINIRHHKNSTRWRPSGRAFRLSWQVRLSRTIWNWLVSRKDLSLWLYEMALVCDAYKTKTLDWSTLIQLSFKGNLFHKVYGACSHLCTKLNPINCVLHSTHFFGVTCCVRELEWLIAAAPLCESCCDTVWMSEKLDRTQIFRIFLS